MADGKDKDKNAKSPPLHDNDTASEENLEMPNADEEEEKKILEILQAESGGDIAPGNLSKSSEKKTAGVSLIDERNEQMLHELEKEAWFHGNMPMEDVNLILKKPGEFLLRTMEPDKDRKNAGAGLVIRVNSSEVREFPVFFLGIGKEQQYSFDGKNTKASVIDLVKMHMGGVPLGGDLKAVTAVPKQQWQLPPERIVKQKKLGEGMFGEVWRGTLDYNAKKVDVAIKIAKVCAANQNKMEEMYKESRIMRQFHHDNIVQFYGMVIQNDSVTIVMELVEDGGLDGYLRKNKNSVADADKLSYAYDASMGLWYMHSRGCIHRDIACRNCLIDLKRNMVKLSDFGLSKKAETYTAKPGEITPIRWQAPEFLRTNVYTKECDVYSLGILFWEIFHKARQPFEGIGNSDIRAKINNPNFRPDISPNVPRSMKLVITCCWKAEANLRPKIKDVVFSLKIYQNHKGDEAHPRRKPSGHATPVRTKATGKASSVRVRKVNSAKPPPVESNTNVKKQPPDHKKKKK